MYTFFMAHSLYKYREEVFRQLLAKRAENEDTEEIYAKLHRTDREFDAILNKDEIFYLLKDVRRESLSLLFQGMLFACYIYDFNFSISYCHVFSLNA